MAYQAEYIWIDGVEPTPLIRSKTKIIADGAQPGIWSFDGSSTEQAPGDKSDCVLKPVFVCPDPLRGRDNVLVMCEVMLVDGKPHATNTRAACEKVAKKYAKQEPLFGIEQQGIGGYLKSYMQPTFFMLPFNVISELSRTLALAVRLFGNMMSGAMIVGILLTITPFAFPIVMTALGLLTGMVQAYIFSILAAVYIAAAVRARQPSKQSERPT